uniref:Uncharacterized protein n=1 Tax=Octopus bimaculoides TaxID=37653 RepID=A0A0L8G9I6_OCTBM
MIISIVSMNLRQKNEKNKPTNRIQTVYPLSMAGHPASSVCVCVCVLSDEKIKGAVCECVHDCLCLFGVVCMSVSAF